MTSASLALRTSVAVPSLVILGSVVLESVAVPSLVILGSVVLENYQKEAYFFVHSTC